MWDIAELAILNITNKNFLNVLKLCLINRIWSALTFDIYTSLLTLIETILKDILWVDNIDKYEKVYDMQSIDHCSEKYLLIELYCLATNN